MRTVLILGGTAEARELAATLEARPEIRVVSSLAGRVARPRLPVGQVRVGGFGGPDGLTRWLDDSGVDAVVDATHPFAERISASATRACDAAGVALLRLERPGWRERPGDRWAWVASSAEAAARVPRLGTRVLLTTGRQGLEAFADVASVWFLIRCVDPPTRALPPRHSLLLSRGPYSVAGELALIDGNAIDLVVTKDSGGDHTRAKLDAARERGVPVIVVRRPPRPPARSVPTVTDALRWLDDHAG